jgi:hypothetical protein
MAYLSYSNVGIAGIAVCVPKNKIDNYNYTQYFPKDVVEKVVDKIGIVSEGNNGWNKELNLISWNEREPVYDIRTWSPDHEKMGKGVTISVEEAKALRDMLNKLNLD